MHRYFLARKQEILFWRIANITVEWAITDKQITTIAQLLAYYANGSVNKYDIPFFSPH